VVLLVGSLVLGILNLVNMVGMRLMKRWAPYMLMLLQVPWTWYDIHTGQYGFLILSVAGVLAGIGLILREREWRTSKTASRYRTRAGSSASSRSSAWTHSSTSTIRALRTQRTARTSGRCNGCGRSTSGRAGG
jgi:hypothetical protein